jgi:ABC-2 type transport system ATP-binding protein
MPLAIRCRDLVKTYPGKPPVEAVCGLNIEVESGECFGLLGPNGAGKTTTLEIIEGLLDATSGEVEVLGMRWETESAAIRRRLGISLQETRLPDKLTVREIVSLFRSFYPSGLTPEDAIAQVSLQEKARSYIVNLSGGQRQRLAVATALVGEPDLLFLDEPTTGLDPQSRRQLWDVIRTLRDRGRTVVITTHYMDEAERLCDRVAVIDHGKSIALGTPRDLILQLGGEHVIEFTVEGELPVHVRGECTALPSVKGLREEAGGYTLAVSDPTVVIPDVIDVLRKHDVSLVTLTTRTATLEDVFVTLTGRHLRDAE